MGQMSGGKVALVAVLGGLLALGMAYGTAWAYSKASSGIDSRGKLMGLGLLQLVVGLGSGAGMVAARRPLGEVAVPAGAVLMGTGVTTGVGSLLLAAQMAGPSSAPSTPSDVGA